MAEAGLVPTGNRFNKLPFLLTCADIRLVTLARTGGVGGG